MDIEDRQPWAAGHGDRNVHDLGPVDTDKLIGLYTDPDVFPSVQIDELDQVLNVPVPA